MKAKVISNLGVIVNWSLLGSAVAAGVWLATTTAPVVGALIVGFWVPFGVGRAMHHPEFYRWEG